MEGKVSICKKIINSRIFNIVLLCLFVLCAGIYNYGLHRSFWPDHEYSPVYYGMFLREFFGQDIVFRGFEYILAYFPYKIFGCSFKAVRVFALLFYQIIMFFSTIVAIYSCERKRFEWYKLGIFAFIAVILHPGSSLYCGGHYEITNHIHQYPYDMHPMPVTYATLSIMLLCIHQGVTERKYKNVLKAIILIVMIMGYKQGDFLYIIGFVGPLICVGLIYLWREKRKIFFALLFGVMAALALLHVVSFAVPSLTTLFTPPAIGGYGAWTDGSTIYGNTVFANLRDIWTYVSNTMTELLAMFNIDISEKNMLSLSMLLAGFRLILVIFMLVCCCRIVINALKKENGAQSIDSINIVLSLGILFNLLIVMFSAYGAGGYCIRYMTLILFYGAILLARQSENIIIKLYGEINNKSETYFFLFFSFAIVANMTTFWKPDDYVADYEIALGNISYIIQESDLGNGIGGTTCAAPLTYLGKGSYAVVSATLTDEGIQYRMAPPSGETVTYNYIVDWAEGPASWFSEEDVYQYLGEPDEVFESGGLVLYYYQDGFTM